MAEREPKAPETKTYKHPSTGRIETAVVGSDVEKALLEQGYVEIDAETGEVKDKKAAARAAGDAMPKPLNPDAKVHTEADIASATVVTKQPSGEEDVTSIPKPLNEPKDKPDAPAVPKRNG
jgi:hypothetical protein